MNVRANLKSCLVMAMFLIAMWCTATEGRTIYVDDDGAAEFDNIQAAINDANDHDIVVVFPGTYTGPGNRDINFGGRAITVRSTDPNDINIVAATIIDCNGTVIEPHRGFYFHSGEDTNSVLDGFSIKNGYVHRFGGGILCQEAGPLISNCVIVGNSAEYSGAGMYNGNSNPTLINCTFSDNYVLWCIMTGGGGGGMTNSYSSPTVINCRFIGNSGPCGGGGMANWWPESCPTVTSSTFSANTSSGMGNNCSSSPILVDCIFTDNSGGGMYGGNPTLTNCIFSRNSTESSGGGIAIWAGGGGSLTVINCTFIGNSAQVNGGGVSIEGSDRATLVNCTFAGNTAPNGNAVACDSYEQSYPSSLHVTNCILWDEESEILNNDNSSITVTYSNVKGTWPGLGNIDADPCFADPCNGDYHLQSQAGRWDANEGRWTIDEVTSPCIDGGDMASPIGYEPFPNGGRVNMGAYGGTADASKSYFGMTPCKTVVAGDINGDCKVNFLDFRIMALHWLEEK